MDRLAGTQLGLTMTPLSASKCGWRVSPPQPAVQRRRGDFQGDGVTEDEDSWPGGHMSRDGLRRQPNNPEPGISVTLDTDLLEAHDR